VKYFRWRK